MTRRRLIKLAGLGGLGVMASAGAAAAADDTSRPESFLEWAYQQRAHAVTTGDVAVLDRIYDSSNPLLGAYERERPRFIRASKLRWPGEVLWNSSTISLTDLSVQKTSARARLVERFETRWRPEAPPARHPRGELRVAPKLGPDRAMSSVALIKHEVDLVRSASEWRIGRDQHDEFDLYGRSPDLVAGSWAAERYGRTEPQSNSLEAHGGLARAVSPGDGSLKGPGLARPLGGHLYWSRLEAYDYGQTYAENPNSNYCNYDGCGGDCTNFVSQCLRDGGHPDIGTWRTYNGGCLGCVGQSKPNSGDTAWIRVVEVWTTLINNGRGQAVGSLADLASADIIQYDWTKNGTWDHAAMTSVWVGGVARVVSHSPFRKDYHWQLDDSDALWRYCTIFASFHA